MKRWFDMKLTVVSTLAVFIWNFIFLAVNVLADYTTTPDKIMFVEERTTVTFSWTVSSSFTINEASFGNGIDKRETTLLKLKPPNITTFVSSEYQKRLVFIGDLSKRKIDFQLIDVKRSDGNKYYGCRSSISPVGGPVSFTDLWSSTQLQVLVAPKFSSSPKVPDFVKEGDSLSIPCSTSEGNPTPVVSWMKGEVNISSGWGRADLNFTSIKRKNNGSYRCVAVNMKMRIQETIQLDIKYKPETTTLLSNATESVAITGEYILLTCNVPQGAANPQSIKYRFYHASKTLQDSSSGEYIIANVQLADKGQYKCVASNIAGDGPEMFINLTVHEPVKIISPSNSEVITRNKGEAVPLVCEATGYPSPKVTWTKDGESVGIDNNATIVKSTRDNAGTYKCTATNGVKEPKTVTITVRIFYEPDIIVGETNSTVGSWNSNTLTLQCVARGEPSAGFQWYKPGGQQITSNISPIKDGTTVTIQTTAPGDYGKYKCRANNTAGFNEHFITVIQWVEPSEPEITVTDDDVGVSFIKLKWTPPSKDGGSPVIDYKVTVEGGDQPRTLPPVIGTHTLIDGLKRKSSYTFVLSARNVVGYGKSVSRTFMTKFKGNPGPSTIKNNETEISSKEITLTWSAARENGAKILTYTVWWRQVDSAGGTGVWFSRNTSSDALSFRVTWLEFGITYDFGVTAWNMNGQSPRDDKKGLKRIKVIQESTKTLPTKEPERSTGVNAAAIGGGAAAAVVIILVVIIVIVIIKRKRSPKKGESRDPLGSNGDEGYSSVSKASAARRLGRNNAANDDAGIPTYATVDKSKKTPKKPDLIYAELADFNETPEARAASMKRQNQPSSYVPTDYAEITQFGRPKEEPMYDNVPRY